MQEDRTEERFNDLPEAVIGDDGHVLIHAITLCKQRCRIRVPDIVDYDTTFLFEVFLPLRRCHFAFLEGTPPIAVTVESAVTGNGYVLCVKGIERRGATFGRDAFEPLIVDLIEIEVVREDDKRVLFGVETDVRCEGDRSGGVETFRDDDGTASGSRTLVNGLLDCSRSEFYAGVVCPVVQHVIRATRERG